MFKVRVYATESGEQSQVDMLAPQYDEKINTKIEVEIQADRTQPSIISGILEQTMLQPKIGFHTFGDKQN